MAFEPHANGVYSVVAVAPSPALSGTSLSVSAGDGATKFPDPATVGPYNISVWPTGHVFDKTNGEIVRITAKTGDVLTLTRNQEGGTARAIVVGDQIGQGVTALALAEIENRIPPIWVPAVQWGSQQAGPTLQPRGTSTGNAFYVAQAWDLSATLYEVLGTLLILPVGFIGKTVQAIVHYSLSAGGAGDWIGQLDVANLNGAQDIDRAADAAVLTTFLAGPAANSYAVSNAGTFVPTTKYCRIAFGRAGPAGGDTYASKVWFLGLELTIP